ncbi:MAG: Na-K-Cl cotransporter [Chloroflexota bacterium]
MNAPTDTTENISNNLLNLDVPEQVDVSDIATDSPEQIAGGSDQAIAGGQKFGTFGGVFTPTMLTVLGAILFLRTGWIVGNAGLGGALLIIGLASMITITTGLAISSIATNIRVRAGGAFSIIAQSLGLEVSGSVSVPFYFAQAIAVAFYAFAFTEGWQRIFPNHPEIIVVFGCFFVAYTLAFISASLAVRTQYFIFAVLILALFSMFLGAFPIEIASVQSEGFTVQPEFIGSFRDGNFWELFAIFFPAVTGLLAGVNMSGDLKNARRSIPMGTMAAVILSSLIYLAVAYWFSRVATPQELMDNQLVAVDRSIFGPLVLAGILAATFSSALTSLVGAPRLLQAIAERNIIPRGNALGKTVNGEPRNAMVVTGIIGFLAIVFGLITGGLDAIAPLMTMFFLITYSVLNAVVVFESLLGLISFRPKFRVPLLVPLIGLFGCIFAMFLIAPTFSLVAVIVIVLLYIYLGQRHLEAPWSDIRSGLLVRLAEWSAKVVDRLPTEQERAWKPDLLFPTHSVNELLGSYRFLKALAYPRGSVRVIGLHQQGETKSLDGIDDVIQRFNQSGIFSRVAFIESENDEQSLHLVMDLLQNDFFRPNGLFLPISERTDAEMAERLMHRAKERGMGMLMLMQHPVVQLGRETIINVWVRDQSPHWEIALNLSNVDLALLMAYQIMFDWKGKMRLITVVSDPENQADGQQFLERIVDLGRMPDNTEVIAATGDFLSIIEEIPRADLNIFGIGNTVELDFMRKMVEQTHSSCLFVQDSGSESALA